MSQELQTAFQLDSLRGSHPIEVTVQNALEIDQIFDAISYLKGSSVIRMLSSHLGEEVFLSGVSDYLKEHSYGKEVRPCIFQNADQLKRKRHDK